jgi:hypothetical protein
VFEVDVNIAVNDSVKWYDKDEMVKDLLIKQKNKEEREKKQRIALEKEQEEERQYISEITPDNNKYECYFNNACNPIKIIEPDCDLNLYAVPCFVLKKSGATYYDIEGRESILIFDTTQKYISFDRIKRNFNLPFIKNKVWYGEFSVIGNISRQNFLYVTDFYDLKQSKESSPLTAYILQAAKEARYTIEDYKDTFSFSDEDEVNYMCGFYYEYFKK